MIFRITTSVHVFHCLPETRIMIGDIRTGVRKGRKHDTQDSLWFISKHGKRTDGNHEWLEDMSLGSE